MEEKQRAFCTRCFADYNKEWMQSNHCINCGSGGSLILLHIWAVESIRKNASWVGKRFYPDKEDFWNSISIQIGKMKTLYIQFKINNSIIYPKKFWIFRWDWIKKD